jgi:hypothetical protein
MDGNISIRKQTLESLTPGILGPSSPTEVEKKLLVEITLKTIGRAIRSAYFFVTVFDDLIISWVRAFF